MEFSHYQLVDFYYLCIVWALYRANLSVYYLGMGLLFLFGKYVFVNSTLLTPMIFIKTANEQNINEGVQLRKPAGWRSFTKKTISVLDDTDVRIHFLAISAMLNATLVPLIFHAVYFNLRWILNLTNAFFKYKIRKEAV